jgi:small subunit ribosomal protein S19
VNKVPKIFTYRGYSLEELKKMSIEEFARLLKARERRRLKRGLTEQQKKLLENIRKNPDKFHKTHVRDMVIVPEMIGAKIGVYIGGATKEQEGGKWVNLTITPEMLGHRLGEFAITTKRVKHSAPGIGATRGSKFIATK